MVDPEELDLVSEDAPEAEEVVEEPKLVRIRYAGNTYEVPEHLADVWTKREEDFNRKLSEQGRELGQLRQQTQVAQPRKPEPPAEDEDLAFFQSPSEMIRRREEALRAQLREEFRQEQELAQQRATYWSMFYKDNPTLVGKERLVNAVVTQEYDALKDLPPAESRIRLAEAIADLVGSPKSDGSTLPRKQVQSERPGNPPAPRQAAPPPKELSLSDELRMRAEARRRAQFNTKE